MSVAEDSTAGSTSTRRPFPLNLRALLLLAAVLALLVGLAVSPVRRALRQRRIVGELRNSGGTVLYDYQYAFTVKNGGSPDWQPPAPPLTILRVTLGDDFVADVVYVQFDSAAISDASLQRLQGLKYLCALQQLSLAGTDVSDQSVPFLVELTQLRILDLRKTQVTGGGVATLQRQLPNCTIRR